MLCWCWFFMPCCWYCLITLLPVDADAFHYVLIFFTFCRWFFAFFFFHRRRRCFALSIFFIDFAVFFAHADMSLLIFQRYSGGYASALCALCWYCAILRYLLRLLRLLFWFDALFRWRLILLMPLDFRVYDISRQPERRERLFDVRCLRAICYYAVVTLMLLFRFCCAILDIRHFCWFADSWCLRADMPPIFATYVAAMRRHAASWWCAYAAWCCYMPILPSTCCYCCPLCHMMSLRYASVIPCRLIAAMSRYVIAAPAPRRTMSRVYYFDFRWCRYAILLLRWVDADSALILRYCADYDMSCRSLLICHICHAYAFYAAYTISLSLIYFWCLCHYVFAFLPHFPLPFIVSYAYYFVSYAAAMSLAALFAFSAIDFRLPAFFFFFAAAFRSLIWRAAWLFRYMPTDIHWYYAFSPLLRW